MAEPNDTKDIKDSEIQKKSSKESKQKKEKGITGKFFKSFVDVKKWVAYDELSKNVSSVLNLYRSLFSKKSIQQFKTETYEEALIRLALTDEQLNKRKSQLLYSSLVYFVFLVCLFSYLIYLLINKHLLSAFIDMILVFLAFLLFYREHFWYMQLSKKKLGCTFSDWIAFVSRRDKNDKTQKNP